MVNPLLKAALPYLAVAGLGAMGLMTKCSYDGKRRAEGAAAVRDSISAVRIDSLTKLKQRRDTLYSVDTVTKWRTVREFATLIDTLFKVDTMTVRESVIVFAADSAIQACRSIVVSCEQRVAVRDSLLSAITADRNVWKSRASPSLFKQATTTARDVAAWELLKAIVRGVQK